jgi:hypothetical protein
MGATKVGQAGQQRAEISEPADARVLQERRADADAPASVALTNRQRWGIADPAADPPAAADAAARAGAPPVWSVGGAPVGGWPATPSASKLNSVEEELHTIQESSSDSEQGGEGSGQGVTWLPSQPPDWRPTSKEDGRGAAIPT